MISPFSLVCVENINPILSFYGVFVMKHFIYLNVAKVIHLKKILLPCLCEIILKAYQLLSYLRFP